MCDDGRTLRRIDKDDAIIAEIELHARLDVRGELKLLADLFGDRFEGHCSSCESFKHNSLAQKSCPGLLHQAGAGCHAGETPTKPRIRPRSLRWLF
jgi:hypothetical protein